MLVAGALEGDGLLGRPGKSSLVPTLGCRCRLESRSGRGAAAKPTRKLHKLPRDFSGFSAEWSQKVARSIAGQREQGGAMKTGQLKDSKQCVDKNPRLHVLVLTATCC